MSLDLLPALHGHVRHQDPIDLDMGMPKVSSDAVRRQEIIGWLNDLGQLVYRSLDCDKRSDHGLSLPQWHMT